MKPTLSLFAGSPHASEAAIADAHARAAAHAGANGNGNGNGKPALSPTIEPKPKSLAIPAQPTEPAPAKPKNNGAKAGERLESLFRELAAETLDAETVRAMIAEETAAHGNSIEALADTVRELADALAKMKQPRSETFTAKIGKATREITGKPHRQFGELFALASARRRDKPNGTAGDRFNILMVGPAGSGKTHAAGMLADALGLDFGHVSISAGMSEAHLTGRYVPAGFGGAFEYLPAPFATFYKSGGVFLLDEIDAEDPNVLTVINSALANGALTLPNGETIQRHPDFVCVAAANTYGAGADRIYAGRNQLDGATLDRFAVCTITWEYDSDFERENARADVCGWFHQVRDRVAECRLRRIVSTRAILDSSDLVESGAQTLLHVKSRFLDGWTGSELSQLGELAK